MASDLEKQAWAAVPGLTEAEQARDLITSIRTPKPELRLTDLEPSVDQALRAGDEAKVEALLAAAPEAIAAEQRAELIEGQRQRAVARARSQVEAIRDEGVDQALTWLAGQLAELVDQVRPLKPALEGVDSAEDALRAGAKATEAWRKFDEAARRYASIRAAQLAITRRGLDGGESKDLEARIATHGQVRNGPRYQRNADLTARSAINSAMTVVDDWPSHLTDQLLWAIRTNAQLWCPTVPELRAAIASGRTPTSQGPAPAGMRMTPKAYRRELEYARSYRWDDNT